MNEELFSLENKSHPPSQEQILQFRKICNETDFQVTLQLPLSPVLETQMSIIREELEKLKKS